MSHDKVLYKSMLTYLHTQAFYTSVLRPFFRDHPGKLVPEENFWTLWCKGRLTEADTPTIRPGATPCGLTSAHLHHPPFFTGRMPFLPPNQQCQSTEGNTRIRIMEKTLEFSSMVLPAPPLYPTYLLFSKKVKVKASHTRYRALGPELIPVYRQSACR